MTRRVIKGLFLAIFVLPGSLAFLAGLAVVVAKKLFHPGALGWFGLWLFNAMFATWTRWWISTALLLLTAATVFVLERRLERRT